MDLVRNIVGVETPIEQPLMEAGLNSIGMKHALTEDG